MSATNVASKYLIETGSRGLRGTYNQLFLAYVVFITCALLVYHFIANGEYSSVLTISVMLQCFALTLLALQTLCTGTAEGISAQALILDALALCCKLSSTLWLNGYLPVDASGDGVIQAADIFSLIIVLWLLHRVTVALCHTYPERQDSFPIGIVACICLGCAALLHADMNRRPIFDTFCMAGLFLSTVAALPQLSLIARTGGRVEALTSHYIAMMALSRMIGGTFMWQARLDITCRPWVKGFNHAVWAILGAHFLHVLLLGDFAFFYIRAVVQQGLRCRVEMQRFATCV